MVREKEMDCSSHCNIRYPCKNHLEIIKNDLGENDERLKIAETLLFEWLNCQPNFPKNYDKNIVRNFLRGSKHNMDRAKQKLEYHFRAKSHFPEVFTERTVSQDVINTLRAVHLVPLSKLTKDGNRIFILKFSETDSNKIVFPLISKVFFMIYDVLLKNPNSVAKEIAVFDCEGASPSHLTKLMGIMKTLMTLLRKAYAMRLREMHFVHTHSGIEKVISLVKPLLHPKIKNSIIFHQDSESLLDHFGGNILPSNYGGNSESLDQLTKEWIATLKENECWLRDQENVKIDGTVIAKTPEKNVCSENEVGLDGCFRKLEID